MENSASILPLQSAPASMAELHCAQTGGLELQAVVYARECAGGAMVGGAILGREGDV